MDLKNIWVNLRATGPAAVTIVWCVCVTLLGLYGGGISSIFALIMLNFAGAFIVGSLFRKTSADAHREEYKALRDQYDNDRNGERPIKEIGEGG